jgi:hypothetical protein
MPRLLTGSTVLASGDRSGLENELAGEEVRESLAGTAIALNDLDSPEMKYIFLELDISGYVINNTNSPAEVG